MKRILNTIKSKIQSFQDGIACVVHETVCPHMDILENDVIATDTNSVHDADGIIPKEKLTYNYVIFDEIYIDDENDGDDDAWEVRLTEEEMTLRDDILEKLQSRCTCFFTSNEVCNDERGNDKIMKSHGLSPRGRSNRESINYGENDIFTIERSISKKRKSSSSTTIAREITQIQHICQTETWDCGPTCIQMLLHWLRINQTQQQQQGQIIHQHATNETNISNVHNTGIDCIAKSLSAINNSSDEDAHSHEGEKRWMIEYIGTESIWTIDLVMLLEFLLYGANNDYDYRDGKIFYEMNNIPPKHDNEALHQRAVSSKQTLPPLPKLPNKAQSTKEYSPSSYLFCSTKLGVDSSYNKLGYYKEAFSSDELRVKRLFEAAQERKLPLMQVKSHLNLAVLVDLASRRDTVGVVLVDNRILMGVSQTVGGNDGGADTVSCAESNGIGGYNGGSLLEGNGFSDSTTSSFLPDGGSDIDKSRSIVSAVSTASINSSYAGHYVILCGVSRDQKHLREARNRLPDDGDDESNYCMVLKNPGIWKETEYVTPARFEKSWRANGTDEDVVFISNHRD
mmetsp:Transcript_18504/g.38353  ORF Transcript_18504/g.38353 Transcript_18504/m.38353 type:complete len:567 (-) Transcript_18504:49-1749(-)